MASVVRIAVDQPSPSGDGLSTIDMGDNSADNDYKPEGTDDGGGDTDLFGGGDDGGGDLFSGGGGGGGGAIGEADMGDAASGEGSPNNPGNLSPEELFVNNNLQTYDTLVTDIKKILLDQRYLDQGEDPAANKITIDPQGVEDVVQNLLRKGWGLDTLMQLSFHSKKNLDNLVSDVVERINKNVSSKIEILGILDKIEGGHDMTQANNATAFKIEDGKVKTVVASTEVAAPAKLTAADKLKQAKEKLGTAIISSKRTIKKAKDGINRINGLLYKRSRKAFDMGAEDATGGEEAGEAAPEGAADDAGGVPEATDPMDKELSTEISDTGSDFDSVVPAIEQLTDAIKELKDALGGVEPGEVSKNEFDEAESMIGEGQGMEDEMYQVNDEVGGLQNQIAASFSKKGKSRKASEGKTYESAAKPKEDTVPPNTEIPRADSSGTKEESKEASNKTSFLDKFLVKKTAKEKTLVAKTDISNVSSAKEIIHAEQVVPAITAGILTSDENFWEIPSTVVASWDNLSEPVNSLKTSGHGNIAESLMKRAQEAHQEAKAAAVGDVRSAKWTEVYKPIEDTSKTMDDRGVESNFARGGDIDKGQKSTHNEFTTDSSNFSDKFGEGAMPGLAPAMGDKNLQGKNVKAELSQEMEFRVRRAMEIAGEEQFKHIIENPMAVAMTKEFMRIGMPENEAIQSSFRVLAEGHEPSFKLALNRGFEHIKKSEQDLIRRSKEVATHKIALFDDESVTASTTEEKRVASVQRKPALRSGQSINLSDEQEARIGKIFESMKQY